MIKGYFSALNIATIPIHIFASIFLQSILINLNLTRTVINKAFTHCHLTGGNQDEIQLHLRHQKGSFPENNNGTLSP